MPLANDWWFCHRLPYWNCGLGILDLHLDVDLIAQFLVLGVILDSSFNIGDFGLPFDGDAGQVPDLASVAFIQQQRITACTTRLPFKDVQG